MATQLERAPRRNPPGWRGSIANRVPIQPPGASYLASISLAGGPATDSLTARIGPPDRGRRD